MQDITPGWGGRLISSFVISGLPSAWSPAGDHYERHIVLHEQGGAWRVEADDLESLWFLNGAIAERHACRLLSALTDLGFDVKMEVRDGSGRRLAEARCEALGARRGFGAGKRAATRPGSRFTT